jgi:ABC-type branched-subunit amino acid transport system substrate-binding protein
MTRSLRGGAVALLLPLLLLAAACGQKPGVAGVSTGQLAAGAVVDPETGELVDPATGLAVDSVDPATGEAVDGAVAVDPATGAPAAGEATGAPGGPAAGPAAPAAGGGDRTGISDKEIRIGIHAPVTGAAPIPQNAFAEGKDVYWRFIDGKGGVHGRSVKVFFEDDKFDPATAVQKCKKMVEVDKVFLLIGGGGADQITACAKYAQSVGVPYLSAGVNEDGLAALRSYFALSTTYSQQSPMLAQLVAKRFPGKKAAIAVADSGSFNDAQASITKAFKDAGVQVVYNKRIPKNANAGDAAAIATALQQSGAQVVYFLSSPTTFLSVSAALNPAYNPQFVGPGITSGLATVATVGCQGRAGIDKAIFLSPFPQLDVIDRIDPDYQRAYQQQVGKKGDDLGLALWGLSKQLKTMFDAAGKDMSRQSFVAALEGGSAFAGGVYPPVRYSGGNHFGGSQVHALQADCGSRTFKTIATFVSGF